VQGVIVKKYVKDERKRDPDRSPNGSLFERHFMRLFVKNTQVERKDNKYENGKRQVESPVLGERKKNHLISSFSNLETRLDDEIIRYFFDSLKSII
jgi:hypothetical protein